MLNRGKVSRATYGAPKQILANVEMQASIGCVVDESVGVAVDGRKIAKAGTPLNVQYGSTTPAVLADATHGIVGYLLHDVDVTNGKANGTLLIFGFIDKTRLDTDVWAKIQTAFTSDNSAGAKCIFGPFVEIINS